MSDRRVLYTTAFIRAMATGMIGILIGLYLDKLQFDLATMGVIVAAGLSGAATAAAVTTFWGERIGRKRLLIGLALLGVAGGIIVALGTGPWILGMGAFLGMVNGMGRDRGAALILEQTLLPGTTTDADRTKVFAWYNVFQDVGNAVGGLLAGIPWLLHKVWGLDEIQCYRLAIGLYVLLTMGTGLVYLKLSSAAGKVRVQPQWKVSPQTRRILWKICPLFGMDSLGGGFLTTALLSVFFHERFGVDEMSIGLLFFFSRVANAFSHLGAAWLAKRIGLVNTMVFTHIPAGLLLVTVAFAPTFPIAAALFLLREALVEMDVPTRQSYVMAVVLPEERTFVSGMTHLVRLGGWAVAPSFAGLFMGGIAQMAPLLCGAGLKIGYDVLLYASFRRLKPPEETV